MSLGFLTESALIPKKAKAIEGVSKDSMTELQAAVLSAESSRAGRALHTASRMRKRAERSVNKGETVSRKEERRKRRRAREEAGMTAEEIAKLHASKQRLREKSELYSKLSEEGHTLLAEDGEEEGDYMVDFEAKGAVRQSVRTSETEARRSDADARRVAPAAGGQGKVHIVDEFGRDRWVEPGCEAHLASLHRQPAAGGQGAREPAQPQSHWQVPDRYTERDATVGDYTHAGSALPVASGRERSPSPTRRRRRDGEGATLGLRSTVRMRWEEGLSAQARQQLPQVRHDLERTRAADRQRRRDAAREVAHGAAASSQPRTAAESAAPVRHSAGTDGAPELGAADRQAGQPACASSTGGEGAQRRHRAEQLLDSLLEDL